MSGQDLQCWGRVIRSEPARVITPAWSGEQVISNDFLLAHGLGRSYGDVCLNNGHTLIDTRRLSRFISFDAEKGMLECESGVTLDEILRLVVPRGWFLPVLPGTRFVTLGGAIANDIHGKNHHNAGSFGRHVLSLRLQRSNGSTLTCSPDENADLFNATVAGLGLTGLILSARIALRPIRSSSVSVENVPFTSIEEFARLSREADRTHEYTVAWLDSQKQPARGIFFRGNHADDGDLRFRESRPRRFPIAALAPFLNPLTVRIFNRLYFAANDRPAPRTVAFAPFFAPLDSILNWNALYGRRGFHQYQFVIPDASGLEPVAEILKRAARSGRASFLTVIKRFGPLQSPGMLSFPRAGITVALDFSRDSDTEGLLDDFDGLVAEADGVVYPAKDARMSGEHFRRFYPRWTEVESLRDPRFSSSFWRRVTT
jgi:FAD/FMN-containing dehydrogenase